MNPTQSNVQQGPRVFVAEEILTGKEGYLGVVVNAAGKPQAALPSAIGALAFYMIHDGAVAGLESSLAPIVQGELYRIPLKGTCVPGDELVLADTATDADRGKVRKLPTAAGTYRVLFLAEESGVDGQFTLCRAAHLGNVTVTV